MTETNYASPNLAVMLSTASVEVPPRGHHLAELSDRFTAGIDVTVTFLPGDDYRRNVETAAALRRLGFNPVLMASANSAGGVMGKMISVSSIAVAAAATNMAPDEEAKLFRFTLKHSAFLACVIGLIALFYTYVAPGLQP